MRAYIIVAATLSIACTGAAAQAYRWVDADGRVHYTQTPPPPNARDVQRKNLRQSGAVGSVDLPYATQLAAKNYPVTLYTNQDCPPCDRARASLIERAIPFREVSVLTQKEADEVNKLSGTNNLPLLLVGTQLQSGFQEGLYNSLLDAAGYPPSGPRVPVETLRKMEPAAPTAGAQPQGAAPRPGADTK